MKDKERLFECGGCGCSFDLDNKHERKILKKHNKGIYPCETFDWFCDNYGAVKGCKCESCLENSDD